MAKRLGFRFEDIHGFLDSLFGADIHAKRVYSLANATMGVMASASLGIHAMGQGLAQARGKLTKHAVKQVDRLLSNAGVVALCTLGALCGRAAQAHRGGDGLDRF